MNLSLTTKEILVISVVFGLYSIFFALPALAILTGLSGYYLYRNLIKPMALKALTSRKKFPII